MRLSTISALTTMFKILALLLCCCVLASAKRAQRIRHGREVTTSEAKGVFGFMAYVSMCRGRGCSSCTGSLIGPDKVLIAAHCVCGNPNRITVYLQTTRAWKGRMAKARIYKRANYNCGGRGYTSDQDVALLKLDQRITDITPVRLECGTVQPGTEVTMIGYGRDENGNSGVLKIGTRRTINCEKRYPRIVCVDGTNDRQTATNPGDSGGPLMIRKSGQYYQVGVVNGAITIRYGKNGRLITETTLTWASVGEHCNLIKS